MGEFVGTVGTAFGVFVGTDIDDLIVLTVLFLTSRASGKPRAWQIVGGQYAGIGVLVAVSALAALGLSVVPDTWVGLLGLIPIVLGVRSLIATVRARNGDTDPTPVVASGLFAVASITIANGADNISVYTPLFRTLGVADSLITGVVFVVLIALWCAVAAWLGSHQRIIQAVDRFGHWIVPGVFIVIGAIIVIDSGVIAAVIARLADLG